VRRLTRCFGRVGAAVAMSIALLTAAQSSSAAETTEDTTPPTLQAFSVNPTGVDTTGGPQTVTGTATITDDVSGVEDTTDPCPPYCGGTTQMTFSSPSGDQTIVGFFGHTTGDTYQASITVPQFAEDGVWTIHSFNLYDLAGNSRLLAASDVAALGIDATITVSAGGTFTLTVSKSGTGEGTVASSPVGIDCGSICSASFDKDTAVTLMAIPSPGSRFVHWSGDCHGAKTCTLVMTASKNVTAVFKLSKRHGGASHVLGLH
jgi:hypothetical protein